ncbi:MAG: glycoside hydrolase family 78 protein, partial [Candidatus Hydrogenedentes bacterium]|nr:glycoside hydrolase family 78 protein [Candidatus Hydrogenedentota bacterium]
MFALFVLVGMFSSAEAAMLSAGGLRCEYRQNPLGIDVVLPRLAWKVESVSRGVQQNAYQVLVASSPKKLNEDDGDLWDSGKVESGQSIHVVYAGAPLLSRQFCYWKVRLWDGDSKPGPWSKTARWTMGLLSEADWAGAWIGVDWMEDNAGPLPWLRKSFTLDTAPERATAYVCALGYYELYVNGKKVDDHVLSPAVSDYGKRGLYLTHDISGYLKKGENTMALWLGRGWSLRMLKGASTNGPVVRAQFEITSNTGAPVTVVTDTSWKAHKSPITPLGPMESGNYGGERYDSRLEMADWATTDFDDGGWGNAVAYEPATPQISAQLSEPNRVLGAIPAKTVKRQEDGTYLVDMGKNFTGWIEYRFPEGGPKGSEVRIEYGDKFLDNGVLQVYNQYDEYVFSGATPQAFRSRFNYHAFRWVHIKGLEAAPRPEDITGSWISTDYAPAATFSCSNELLNDIYDTASWTYRCLTLGSYVVDCPHRERLGYGGDSGTSMEMGMTNFQTAPLYTKWLRDWRDTQVSDGDLPHTAPNAQIAGGGPAWSGICVTMPWQVYLQFGDQRILEQSYPTMQRWLSFLKTKMKDGILAPYSGVGYSGMQWSFLGDWVPPNRDQSRDRVDDRSTLFFNNCYYVHNLQLAAQTALVLGKPDDAADYTKQAKALSTRLHARFLNDDGVSYVNGEQPYLAMPLLFGITPEDKQEAVMDALRDLILVKQKGHLNTGMHGTYFMIRYLTDNDHSDLVYAITSKRSYPSWGYMLDNDATTIWEEWDGDNSHIHDTLISVGMWFVQGLAGIQPDPTSPGFKHFFIRPALVGDLTQVSGSHVTLYGRIVS